MAESLFAIEGKSAVPNTRYLNLWVSQILVTGIRLCSPRLIFIVAIGRLRSTLSYGIYVCIILYVAVLISLYVSRGHVATLVCVV